MRRSDTTIKTDRLWLRQIDETDADSIVCLRGDEEVYKFFLNPTKLTVSEHKKWYEFSYILSDNRIDWIAVDDNSGSLVGVYGAKKNDASKSVELSYITAPEKQHMGYASEAMAAIEQWCIKQWKTEVFVLSVHKDNKSSIKFADKNGFKRFKEEDNFYCYKKEVKER